MIGSLGKAVVRGGLLFLILSAAAACDDARPPGAAVGGDPAPRMVGEDVRCPLCGMFPARYPRWQAQAVMADGRYAAFDGAKHLFAYLADVGRYTPQYTRGDVAAVYVKDFATGGWIAARDALFAVGSTEQGPMGFDLVPFRKRGEAEAFVGRAGGRVVPFDEVGPETLAEAQRMPE